ncbi:MAG: hypothetical protein Q7S27_03025 [Nanoarchaeota archaeon]|nr:hypothetical protein [Nanoarchaeota archaeon]
MKRIKKEIKNNLGELFLTNFINAIIEFKADNFQVQTAPLIKKQNSTSIIPKVQPINPKVLEDLTEQLQHINPTVKPMSTNQEHPFLSLMHQDEKQNSNMPSIPKMQSFSSNQKEKPIQIKTKPLFASQNNPLGIFLPFLNDPFIKEISCPGPNKNIIVSKGNMKSPIALTLSSDEIERIMKEISIKTKIPLIQGMFKAAMGNLLISAVISEFVGTHFTIQKIAPPPMTPMPLRRY